MKAWDIYTSTEPIPMTLSVYELRNYELQIYAKAQLKKFWSLNLKYPAAFPPYTKLVLTAKLPEPTNALSNVSNYWKAALKGFLATQKTRELTAQFKTDTNKILSY